MEKEPCPVESAGQDASPPAAAAAPPAKPKGGRPKKDNGPASVPEPPRAAQSDVGPAIHPPQAADTPDGMGPAGAAASVPSPKAPKDAPPKVANVSFKAPKPKKAYSHLPCVVRTRTVYYGGRRIKVDEVDDQNSEDEEESELEEGQIEPDSDEYSSEEERPIKKTKKRVKPPPSAPTKKRHREPTPSDEDDGEEYESPARHTGPAYYIL